MLAILFLAGAGLLGVGLVRRVLRGLLDGAELLTWGVVTGWMLSTLVVYALARWQGSLTAGLVLWITVFIWGVALLFFWPAILNLRRRPRVNWPPHYSGLVLVVVLFAPIYWKLFSTHSLAPGSDGVYSGGTSAGDICFHALLASSFVYGQNFPPVYTPLPPERLLYPFMPDFQAATLMSTGLSLRMAFLVTGLALALVITVLFYQLAFRLLRSSGTAVLATILFLLNGGFGFVGFVGDWKKSGKGLGLFWSSLEINYANIWDRGIHWNNIITDMILPQRTSLFGLPAALIISTIMATVWERGSVPAGERQQSDPKVEIPSDRRLLVAAGALTGVLPFFHMHTYVALGFVSVCLFAFRPRRAWLAFWIPAALIASPHLIGLIRYAAIDGVLRLQPGWMGHDSSNFPLYLIRNLGLPLLLIIPAWFAAPLRWRKFYLAFVLLLVFTFVVVYSPNLFDNGKPIYYWHALTSILVGSWLFKLATLRRQRLLATLLTLLCIASGLLALQAESLRWDRVFTTGEINAASFARSHTAPHSVFLTAPVQNQPILVLAGRPIVRGSSAWLWSHGYELREREADVRRMYAGTDDALELMNYYRVGYVYFGDAERRDLKANFEFFESHFPVVYRSEDISIYDTQNVNGLSLGPSQRSLNSLLPTRELASRLGKDPYSLLAEFGRVAYPLCRLYRVAFGRLPKYEEFMADMLILGRGLFVGSVGWQQILQNNRNALLERWLLRNDFRALYESRSNEQYVDTLLNNAGLALNSSERASLISNLDPSLQTRAGVLRQIADKTGSRASYNEAYVLINYFAYLGRDPDDPPDNNLSGFNFWLNDLNHTDEYRTLSRVFLESDEYKNRQPVK